MAFVVTLSGLEAVFEVAESLINKGIQRFLPQDCPKKIIKINQPNFVYIILLYILTFNAKKLEAV